MSADRPVGGAATSARLAFLETVVDACPDAVLGVDGAGTVTSWNRAAERLFGWTEAEVVGRPVTRLFPEELRPTLLWLLDIVATGDRIERYDVDVERKGGMPTPIALTLCPVSDARGGGAGRGAAIVARDMTEQRLAQASLAETEARVQEGEAITHVGRWLWDVATDTVQWSEEVHRIHGIDPWQFGGDLAAHVGSIVHDDRTTVEAALAHAIERRRPFEAEYDIVRPDGQARHLYARAEPTIGSGGVVVGMRGIIRDTSIPMPG
jgi:PAS domain S-box-containing protein